MKRILYGNCLQQFEILEGYAEGNLGKLLKFSDRASAFLFLANLCHRNHSNQVTLREVLFTREQTCWEDCIVLERLSWELVSGSIQIRNIEEKLGTGRSLILSFDDGPAPNDALTSILNTLEKNAIKAEFYVLGKKVKANPSLAKMIVSKGHRIQNHSWSHKNLATATEKDVKSELQKTQDIIKQMTGVVATKVRPPYGAGGWGKFDPELLKSAQSLSLTIQNWDIDTEDWKSPQGIGSEKLKNIEKQLRDKKDKTILNILMHVKSETARDLNTFISTLNEWGFTFADP
ncbi:MAG: polysaccharide deacetylase family protein [Thioploca sp.]|nr:polysaccharide deacetylase family protein [Thioploca sp.]